MANLTELPDGVARVIIESEHVTLVNQSLHMEELS